MAESTRGGGGVWDDECDEQEGSDLWPTDTGVMWRLDQCLCVLVRKLFHCLKPSLRRSLLS